MPLPLLTVEDPTLQFNFDEIANAVSGFPRIVSGGSLNIATSQATTSTSYTTLTTPDTVTVDLPTNGLIAVWYQALWQNDVTVNGKAAIFIGANQLKSAPASGGAGGAPAVQEATGNNTINKDAVLSTRSIGLTGHNATADTTEVTTGQIVGVADNGVGGPVWIFADAGSYDVSIKFKNVGAGTTTVQKRHLWVATYAFN